MLLHRREEWVEPRPAHALGPERAAARLSDAIRVARVICILGIVYVHGWTGRNVHDLARLRESPQGVLRWVLIELLALSAVPLLSVISGWLAGPSLARRGAWGFVRLKLRTVLLPMVAWNGLAIVLVGGVAAAGWLNAPRPTSWGWVANELLCLTRPDDINVQMPFLRDLFLCLMAVPLLARLSDAGLGLVALAALGWALLPGAWLAEWPVLQRPSILLFFALGMLVRRRELAAWIATRPFALLALPYAALVAARVWLEVYTVVETDNPLLLAATDLAMRLATAVCFWALAWRLAGVKAGRWLLRAEPYAFLTFCAQLILIWLGGPVLGRLSGPFGAPFYPLFLLMQPALVLAATVALGRGLQRIAPGAAKLLSGGRLAAHARRA